ncbi:MAG: UDP-3-O-(3-hydroxymyristoyl)glucosamine N-acyltransferase [Deltaproteobacteria bacterium]|nr:UDP-3-O-(3-hydroxymyristoyl)glucosamine N-acyltransferase [Deltaproteobacteria bacterium]
MLLNPPRPLSDLADYVRSQVISRFTDLGSPDLDFEIGSGGDIATMIRAVSPIEALEPGSLTFAVNQKFLSRVESSPAAAVILPSGLRSESIPYLTAPEPRLAFSIILELTSPGPTVIPGFPGNVCFKDPNSVSIGQDVIIGDLCYIGRNVRIGRGTRIYPTVFIDDEVSIGEDCLIYPHAAIFKNTLIGRHVIIHSGAVIGDDGFGYNQVPDLNRGRLHHLKNYHAGGVTIEDFVEIGSQVCVDRGLAGRTTIGSGTKIDNLVQIGHNCQIGQDGIIVSQAGLAGHVSLGNRVFVLGQSGFAPGVAVGDDAVIAGQAGVTGDIPSGRAVWSGVPAQKQELEYRQKAMARRMLPRVQELLQVLKNAKSFEDFKANLFKASEFQKMEGE